MSLSTEKREKMLNVLRQIRIDAEQDMVAFEGQEFNGRNVSTLFGNQRAAIDALANMVAVLIEFWPTEQSVLSWPVSHCLHPMYFRHKDEGVWKCDACGNISNRKLLEYAGYVFVSIDQGLSKEYYAEHRANSMIQLKAVIEEQESEEVLVMPDEDKSEQILDEVLEQKDCSHCHGEGKVANSDDQEPWSIWSGLPPGSDLAVQLGLVRPMTCPACAGKGKVPA